MEKKSPKKRSFKQDIGANDTSPKQNTVRSEHDAAFGKEEREFSKKKNPKRGISVDVTSPELKSESTKNDVVLGSKSMEKKSQSKRDREKRNNVSTTSPELFRESDRNNDDSKNESSGKKKTFFSPHFIETAVGSAIGAAVGAMITLIGVAWTITNNVETTQYAFTAAKIPYIVMTEGGAVWEINYESLQKELEPFSESLVTFSVDEFSEEVGKMECRIDSKFSLYTVLDKYKCYYCRFENVGEGAMYKMYLSTGNNYQEADYGQESESKDLEVDGFTDSFSEYIQPVRVGDCFYLIVNMSYALPRDSYWFDLYIHYEDIYKNEYIQPALVHFVPKESFIEVVIESDAQRVES